MVPCTWTALAVLALHAAVGGGHLVPRASRAPIGTASRIVMMPRSMRPREARKAVKREWRSKRFEESELALAQISSNRSATSRAGETLRAPRRMRGVDLTQGVDRRTRSDLKLYITGGEQKGRKLRTPAVYIRPMMAQVREAMFSMLGDLVELGPSASALDLFSGSGCVGLETLSRGCERVASVDLSADCVDVMRANARMCGYEERHVAVCARAEAVLAEPTKYGLSPPFDLITLTPPYEEVREPPPCACLRRTRGCTPLTRTRPPARGARERPIDLRPCGAARDRSSTQSSWTPSSRRPPSARTPSSPSSTPRSWA